VSTFEERHGAIDAVQSGPATLVQGDPDLTGYEDEALLRAFAALTHQMHGSPEGERRAHHRAQRDLVEAEVLRRMGSYRV
jgi:hypothetical protein